jgi:GT2 family glycosyltransferase
VRVAALVVTYNRKHLLARCAEAVLSQTRPVASLLVCDSASTDGTEDYLREQGLLDRPQLAYLRLEYNVGGAGGFSEGISQARRQDSDWLWVMDDDSEPLPDALELLLDSPPARELDTVALCPQVRYPGGGVDVSQRGHFRRRLRPLPESDYVPGRYPDLGYLSFVGSLIRTDAARAEAPPRAEFFVWGDDVEYSLRLRRRGRIRLVPESVMVHKRAVQSYSNARSRFWNLVLPVRMYPTPAENFWQNLCGLRNYIWTKRVYEGQGRISAAGTTAQFMLKALLYDERPLRRLPWIVRFAIRGRKGNFENIAPSRWREMARRGQV